MCGQKFEILPYCIFFQFAVSYDVISILVFNLPTKVFIECRITNCLLKFYKY